MADTLKILGQLEGPASLAVLYTVPEGAQTTISCIYVCRKDTTNGSYDIAVRKNGAGISPATVTDDQWIAYETSVWANTTAQLGAGITLNDNDDIIVRSSDTNLVFSCYGVETTED